MQYNEDNAVDGSNRHWWKRANPFERVASVTNRRNNNPGKLHLSNSFIYYAFVTPSTIGTSVLDRCTNVFSVRSSPLLPRIGTAPSRLAHCCFPYPTLPDMRGVLSAMCTFVSLDMDFT